MTKLDIGIGILTWRKPNTLSQTLSSYQNNGLLESVKETIVLIQEGDQRETEICKKFGVSYVTTSHNIGIGKAISMLANMLDTKYFLFLENDWLLIEGKEKVLSQLELAIKNIENNVIDCYRLRHRTNCGSPLCSYWLKGQELRDTDHLLDCVHWCDDPDVRFPEYIKKVDEMYVTSAKFANHTNNPVIYVRQWYVNNLCPMYKGGGRANEMEVFHWWNVQNLRVGQGHGLFQHNDLFS